MIHVAKMVMHWQGGRRTVRNYTAPAIAPGSTEVGVLRRLPTSATTGTAATSSCGFLYLTPTPHTINSRLQRKNFRVVRLRTKGAIAADAAFITGYRHVTGNCLNR